MPYIEPSLRKPLDRRIQNLSYQISTAGELNYVITRLLIDFVGNVSYTKLALATGVLETAKLELYRRLAAPYEDAKRDENGEVY